jgi:hypothetical protein
LQALLYLISAEYSLTDNHKLHRFLRDRDRRAGSERSADSHPVDALMTAQRFDQDLCGTLMFTLCVIKISLNFDIEIEKVAIVDSGQVPVVRFIRHVPSTDLSSISIDSCLSSFVYREPKLSYRSAYHALFTSPDQNQLSLCSEADP